MEYKFATEIVKGDVIIDNGTERLVLSVCVSNDPRLKGAIIIEFKNKLKYINMQYAPPPEPAM